MAELNGAELVLLHLLAGSRKVPRLLSTLRPNTRKIQNRW